MAEIGGYESSRNAQNCCEDKSGRFVISNPPFFPGEPRDIADRAWHAGPNYRDVVPLFDQARERLAPGGRIYLLVSSDSDLDLFSALIVRAGLQARLVAERSIFIESLIIYELEAL